MSFSSLSLASKSDVKIVVRINTCTYINYTYLGDIIQLKESDNKMDKDKHNNSSDEDNNDDSSSQSDNNESGSQSEESPTKISRKEDPQRNMTMKTKTMKIT